MGSFRYKTKENWEKQSDYACPISEIDDLRQSNRLASNSIQKLRKKVEILEAALEFCYDNEIINISEYVSEVQKRAKQALQKAKELG